LSQFLAIIFDFLSWLSGVPLVRLAVDPWDYTISSFELFAPVFGQFNFVPSKQPLGSQESFGRNGKKVGGDFDHAGNVFD
jgi:hypothetical protein